VADEVRAAVADGYKRLLAPAIERDLRSDLTERAETHALTIFAANLRGLLLQPPLREPDRDGPRSGLSAPAARWRWWNATGKYLEWWRGISAPSPTAPKKRC